MPALTTFIVTADGEVGYNGTPAVPPPPGPPAGTTIFGFNTNEKDTFEQTIAGRKAWWSNRAPCVRRYHSGMLPATFAQTVAQCPEKRTSVSFKPSTGFSAAQLAAGGGNTRLRQWLESIPPGWKVWLTYYHEPNDDFQNGRITPAQFTQAYAQFYPVIQSAALATGVEVKLCANFMAYQLTSVFSDSWVPAHGTMDLLTFDIYGNPGNNTSASGTNKYGTATGSGYGTTYPDVVARCRDMFAVIRRLGWQEHWGVLEVNTPARTWDTDESSRALWLTDIYEYFLNPPLPNGAPPEIVLLWEAPSGVNWDQAFGRTSGNPLVCADALAPYIEGTPLP